MFYLRCILGVKFVFDSVSPVTDRMRVVPYLCFFFPGWDMMLVNNIIDRGEGTTLQ